ncbi:SulP family inorganic anion transporter [Marivirga sp. S37H4]|uniref:SulP family inorganic anion transporter n=1 Tax=Marivirga aurantiaca TaxID=2802615 RepID=A0A934WX84_9BACT|nr:SulP family inorganic anion transporter [Marivirga aurantiaca]MBK6264577.1 SulP family inorganic anion transporter [Marivirga aurantiaca]
MRNKNIVSQLKLSWKSDMISGFMVFLLALPLSLGIAKASGYPAAMGVLSAMIGGIATLFFNVAPLTIKGPAAGLITISAAAMLEFGGNEKTWQIVSAVVVVMAILQILTGILKLGSLSDFFPHSAVHGMLAAIGIIIILKQIPVLLGDEPSLYQGEGPIELLMDIPEFIMHAHWHIALVGITALVIMVVFPKINNRMLKSIPAPLVVLLVAVPLSIVWHFNETEPPYSLVSIGDFWGSIGLHIDFSAITTFTFWKYVLMFYFVSSLESLLTVKAIDGLDPAKRISNPNGDIIGQGSANTIAGLLGGTPVISEVVRSSANVSFNAQSKWANFFHGLFLLLAMIFMIPLIELIPNAALAAMLIYAGYNLTAPKHYIHAYKIGKEQLLIFLVTVIVTLVEDLLLGIAAGIVVKFIIELRNGVPFKSLFKANLEVVEKEQITLIKVKDCAIFSNLIGIKKAIEKYLEQGSVELNFSQAKYIDHSFMAYVKYIEREAELNRFIITGLENHRMLSNHSEAARKLKN